MVSFEISIQTIISFVALLIPMRPPQQQLVVTMKDSPPNPEDGELWLPSDVFHEIVCPNSATKPHHQHVRVVTPSSNNINPIFDFHGHDHDNNTTTNTKSPSLPKPNPKPKPKPKAILDVYKCGAIGNGVPNHYNNNQIQPVARPIHTYNPMFQPTITPTIQESKGKRVVFGDQNKLGGTGVFLPHRYSQTKKSGLETITADKNKQSRNNYQENKKDNRATKSNVVKQDCKVFSGSHLPKDWAY